MNATLETRIAERTAELARSEAQLRQSLKMEAVGQMTGGLAHDFNNLLTGIIGSLDLASLRLADGRLKELDHYLKSARGAAGRAATLTHRLLAFSRQQPLEPQPTNLITLLGEFEELIQRTLGPSITLEIAVEDAVWTALCDPNQLENAVLNLCINARDAMADGGRLVISAGNRSLDTMLARKLDLNPGEYVALSVIDTGTGMTDEVIARAFDPFYTTKPLGQGTGLGLSMVYGFAQQSDGAARIDSVVGQGTTITIYLPRCADEAAATAG
jgi:signal transduction histidine kinase